jgi:hypothetical protein
MISFEGILMSFGAFRAVDGLTPEARPGAVFFFLGVRAFRWGD